MKKINPKVSLEGIKICRISSVSYYLVSQLWNQAEYMKDAGMNVVLVSSDGPELRGMKFNSRLTHKIIEIPRSLDLWKDIIAFFKLIDLFFKCKFDIVHSTTPKAGLLTAIASFIARVPIRLHTWTGQQWVTMKGPIRWISRIADTFVGILNTECYADSKSQRRFLIDEKIVSPKKISVIGSGSLAGIDVDRFHPKVLSLSQKKQLRKTLNISDDSNIFIFIGRVTRDKGIVELISAFLKIIHLDYNVDLLIVGPLDEECGGSQSIDLSLIKQNSRIHYVGQQKYPEHYLSISNIFCLPSYREGFGTAVIEAAAMGLPAIGTRIIGVVDAVRNGETGILVNPYDDLAICNAMKQLLDDSQLMEIMGCNARERCLRLFDSRVLNQKLIEEYIHLLQNFKARKIFK
jgi:glycosyltransferase involved in cell wall biosynthesis